MTETDDLDAAAARLEAALTKLAQRQAQLTAAVRVAPPDPRVLTRLDNMIRTVRDALEA